MRIRFLIILHLVLLSALWSCKASRHLTSSAPLTMTEEAYVVNYKDIAIEEMKRTGIPASITLAQGMIESDYGRSTLAREANNHFGIKCHSGWTGPTVYHHDDRRNECFRKYSRAEDSFYDHSDFLKSGSRYSFLFNYSNTDYKAWAHGLKKAGYATNPDYANMLIRKIEEKSLFNYDSGNKSTGLAQKRQQPVKEPSAIQDTDKTSIPFSSVNMVGMDNAERKDNTEKTEKTINKVNTSTPPSVSSTANRTDSVIPVIRENPVNERNQVAARVPRVMENNRIRYIVVKDGDTREKLEEEFQLLKWELSNYNDLSVDFTLSAGQILYLQPKKDKAEPGKEFHNTAAGDTMYMISQKYGVKLKSLYKMNRMEENTEPEAGSKIWLRSIKPVN
jgi:LysM repeat protein